MNEKQTLYIVTVNAEGGTQNFAIPYPKEDLSEDNFQGLLAVLQPVFGTSSLRYAYYQSVTTGERIPIA